MIKRSTSIVAGIILLVISQAGCGESPSDAQPQAKQENRTTSASVNIQNLFTPSGWMGDGEFGPTYIEFSGKDTENPHSAPTSIKITYTFKPNSWAGLYWQNQPNNWGDKPGNNYSGSSFSKVTFWARGRTGKEVIEFKSGGIDNIGRKNSAGIEYKYRDSYVSTIGRVDLGKEWKQYQIPLTSLDLSSVIGAFCWVASPDHNEGKSVTFYLDDIVLE